ncbi:hypothetical protein K469DRAFT_747345 [Zopfia rhizophila CBS 207.26]|uniref:Uncharacterized protein n=1 Tax=Zopfia rhizophila CBS 207.26 TaxID=1314779 RepID=A0A6A6EJL1_9PEZI|nr:hypothetical protein K469DRAFT_747345 [Zopfia rhizophila CBS 207.26]
MTKSTTITGAQHAFKGSPSALEKENAPFMLLTKSRSVSLQRQPIPKCTSRSSSITLHDARPNGDERNATGAQLTRSNSFIEDIILDSRSSDAALSLPQCDGNARNHAKFQITPSNSESEMDIDAKRTQHAVRLTVFEDFRQWSVGWRRSRRMSHGFLSMDLMRKVGSVRCRSREETKGWARLDVVITRTAVFWDVTTGDINGILDNAFGS